VTSDLYENIKVRYRPSASVPSGLDPGEAKDEAETVGVNVQILEKLLGSPVVFRETGKLLIGHMESIPDLNSWNYFRPIQVRHTPILSFRNLTQGFKRSVTGGAWRITTNLPSERRIPYLGDGQIGRAAAGGDTVAETLRASTRIRLFQIEVPTLTTCAVFPFHVHLANALPFTVHVQDSIQVARAGDTVGIAVESFGALRAVLSSISWMTLAVAHILV